MHKVLVVGIGNLLRQDDGVGPYIIDLLQGCSGSEKDEPVDYLIVHQLDMDHCEVFSRYSLIIFVDADACEATDDIRGVEVVPKAGTHPFTAHIGSIPDLLALTEQLYNVSPRAILIAVKGYRFEIGEGLSKGALANANTASRRVRELIGEFFPFH